MATSAPDDDAIPAPNAGAFPLQPSPVIEADPPDASAGAAGAAGSERLPRSQKPRPTPRKDGSRPSDIAVGTLDPASPLRNVSATAHRRNSSPFSSGTSPSRFGRSSPRRLSPATSQIFERDVQESSSSLAPELSPAIPSHITTEDHIPPVLEASSLAITDRYDPDEVEIVMHSAHQPAAASIVHSALGESHPSAHGSHSDLDAVSPPVSLPGGLSEAPTTTTTGAVPIPRASPPISLPHQDSATTDEKESTYGTVDPADPRRLSFISFADVINAEHAEMAHSQSLSDATVLSQPSTAPSSLIGGAIGNRSPSPARSPLAPASPAGRAPPVPLGAGDASPVRGGAAGSFKSVPGFGGHAHSEITIETMRQTLQKTGSNDPVPMAGGAAGGAAGAEDVASPPLFK